MKLRIVNIFPFDKHCLISKFAETTVNSNFYKLINFTMQKSNVLINDVSKFKRAFNLFEYYLKNENYLNLIKDNLLPEQIKEIITGIKFTELRGIIYSFLDKNNIFISISPYDINYIEKDNKAHVKWRYIINIDGNDIIESDFDKREYAEFICFKKAFQFLDTKLFIEQTSNRFYDETSDSSCLNVNWKHLDKVLNHKRKLLNSTNE